MSAPPVNGLLSALVREEALSSDQAKTIQSKAEASEDSLLNTVIAEGVSAATIAAVASKRFGLPLVDLDAIDTSDLPLKLVPEKVLQANMALPLFKRGRRLTVAVADPSDTGAIDGFRFSTNMAIEAVVAEAPTIARLLEEALSDSMDAWGTNSTTTCRTSSSSARTTRPTTSRMPRSRTTWWSSSSPSS